MFRIVFFFFSVPSRSDACRVLSRQGHTNGDPNLKALQGTTSRNEADSSTQLSASLDRFASICSFALRLPLKVVFRMLCDMHDRPRLQGYWWEIHLHNYIIHDYTWLILVSTWAFVFLAQRCFSPVPVGLFLTIQPTRRGGQRQCLR